MGDGHDPADTAPPVIAAQVAWDEARAAWWLAGAEEREKQLLPVSDALFARAALQPGEHVLDVGVGSGPTTWQAWEAVQPGGSVTGVDISPSMIAAARQRVPVADIEWIVGDAATHAFTPGHFDAVISRFGVMFFADPVAAFNNLRAATRIGGRLIVTVWSQLFASGLFAIPYTVATTTLHRLGVPYQAFPPDGILFSLGRPGLARTVLEAAGWADVETSVDNRNALPSAGPAGGGTADDGRRPCADGFGGPVGLGASRGGGSAGGRLRASSRCIRNRAPGRVHRGFRLPPVAADRIQVTDIAPCPQKPTGQERACRRPTALRALVAPPPPFQT